MTRTRPCRILLMAFVLLALAPAMAWAQDTWPEKLWNPQPQADDIVLDLPCGGAIALRRVDTFVQDNWLTDLRLAIGSNAPSADPWERARIAYLAGGLSDGDDPARRYYLIGKYEVSADQFAAVMAPETCTAPSMRGRLPVEAISWFDAVEFTRRLTLWLLEQHPDDLPREDGSLAYVRLPTDEEWEFAVRGGLAVGAEEFAATTFAMPEGMESYVWFQGPSSCDGGTQVIGLTRPNPLGLHDALGNVAEMVLTPYTMAVAGRQHGHVGGFSARGGNCLTARQAMASALRIEYPLFDVESGETRPPLVGFRIAVSAPVNTSLERIEAFRADAADAAGLRAFSDADAAPMERLRDLAEEAAPYGMQDELEAILHDLNVEFTARNQLEARAIQSTIKAGAALIRQYRDGVAQLTRLTILRDNAAPPQSESEKLVAAARDDALARQSEVVAITREVYVSLLVQTADDYGAEALVENGEIVSASFEALGAAALSRFALTFVDQVMTLKSDGRGAIEPLIEALDD
jgi:hypothetical protein